MVSVESLLDVDVDHGAAQAFVAKKLLHMQDVLRLVVFHCSFPMSDGRDGQFEEPRIVKLPRYPLPLMVEVGSHTL